MCAARGSGDAVLSSGQSLRHRGWIHTGSPTPAPFPPAVAMAANDFEKLRNLYDADLHKKYNLSLANFNEKKSGPPYLTSPRSIEACLRQGVKPKELIVK